MRHIRNYKNISKEGLLIALLRSKQSLAELYNKIEEAKMYPDHDDPDYEEIRDIENLFDEINEEYYKPVNIKSAFNDNYIEYESRGNKEKNLLPKEYLDMIRPYLRDMINNHKTPLKGSLGKITDHDLHGEWKIQLTMEINFIFSLDSGEIRAMDSKSKNITTLLLNMITLEDYKSKKRF